MAGPEATIERKSRQVARAKGCQLYKVVFHGRVGCPDRLLLVGADLSASGSGSAVFMEFKRPGETPGPHQELVHRELRQAGLRVESVDSIERFEEILSDALER